MRKIIFFLVLVSGFLFFDASGVSAQVVINEFLPKPNPEWVEFYNKSTNEINLDSYFFDDDTDFNSDSGSSAKFNLQGLLPSGGSCYWEMNSFLNDGGDSATLFAANGDIIDNYSYASSSAGLSYSRVPDGGNWQVNAAPTKTTTSCLALSTPTPVSTPTPNPTSTPTPAAAPAKTQTPAPTRTPTPIPKKTQTPAPTATPEGSVLGEETIIPSPTVGMLAQTEDERQKNKFPFLAIVLVIAGVGLIGFSVFTIIKNAKKSYTIESGKENNQIS